MVNTYQNIRHVLIFMFLIATFWGCKKLVEVDAPITSTNGENVYENDATAIAVLNGVYIKMSSFGPTYGNYMNGFMSFYAELSADNLTLYDGVSNPSYSAYYMNNLQSSSSPNIWLNTYPVIFVLNSAIEGLSNSKYLTPAVRQQLLGEAIFLRAFNYFYLINLYGDVPLVLTSDYKNNAIIAKSSKQDVYKQIVSDLDAAKKLLTSSYVGGDAKTITSEKTRPNSWAAAALLARVYLYTGDWINAEKQADSIIMNAGIFSLVDLDEAFFRNNSEAIWQLQPVNVGWNTQNAILYVIPSTGLNNDHPVYLSNNLLNSFELGDNRLTHWVNVYTDTTVVPSKNYFYSFKYKSASLDAPVTEYETLLRLGEQYLIRAEAKAQQEKISGATGAIADLDAIRTRAKLLGYNGLTDKASVLSAILHERQVELFTEMGHRWLDLKRSGYINSVMGSACAEKGGSWNNNWQWYPLAQSELKLNNKLVQNEGY